MDAVGPEGGRSRVPRNRRLPRWVNFRPRDWSRFAPNCSSNWPLVRTAAAAGFSLGSSGTLDHYLRRIRWPTGAAELRAAAEARPKATLLELLQ